MLYTVQPEDSLSKIAARELNDMTRWPEIARLNRLAPPYVIHPNELLLLPAPAPVPAAAPVPGPPAADGVWGFMKRNWLWFVIGAGLMVGLAARGGPRRRR